MPGYQKRKLAEKPEKKKKAQNGKESCCRLVKQRKQEEFQKLSENGRRNILQKREVYGQNGRVRISAVYFKDNFSHNIP